MCKSLELSGVACCWDGVEGSECGRGDFGLEINHVEHAANTGVGGKGLHHDVGVGVLIRIGLILEHAGKERGELLKRIGLDAAPDLVNGIGGYCECRDDA